jgi:CheY-like chemotaxis protein
VTKILLVEDDPYLRRACETSLRRQGYAVVSAVDGEQGLALARTEAPDLVLLDMLMPKLTGLDVLRALRAAPETCAIPVLILSNSSRQADVEEVQQLGVAGYLVKANLSLEQLGEEVRRLCGEKTR